MSNAIIELESKLAFLEKNNNELSDVVYQQQRQIDQLQQQVQHLADKLRALQDSDSAPMDTSSERPPHY